VVATTTVAITIPVDVLNHTVHVLFPATAGHMVRVHMPVQPA
jgi:hypothetical protein